MAISCHSQFIGFSGSPEDGTKRAESDARKGSKIRKTRQKKTEESR
jgi:hypothetical protein